MNTTAKNSRYQPSLPEKTPVRLVKSEHPANSQHATVIHALPNPSGQAEHQWYDVRFDNGMYGRFRECYLERINEESANVA